MAVVLPSRSEYAFYWLEIDNIHIFLTGILEKAEQFWQQVNERYQQLDVEALAPSKLFLQLLNLLHIFLSLNQKVVNNHLN